jgi:5-methylcytosine-specific restriction endonuclease McrA
MSNPAVRAKATASFKKMWANRHDEIIAKIHTKANILKRSRAIMGKNHWNWQGGKTSKNRRLRNSFKARQWRKAVWERDNYTCQECGSRSGKGNAVILNADHIKEWAHYPKLRFDIKNGRTLCLDCHKKTSNFGIKARLKKSN